MSNTSTIIPLCPGILKLRTNVSAIPDFQLATELTGVDTSEESPLTVEYVVDRVTELRSVEKGIQLEGDSIVYKKSLGLLGDLKCKIDIDEATSRVTVNKRYHQLGRASIDTVPSVGKLLEDVISMQLLMNDYTLLHCGGVQRGDETFVLIGLANTGKTTTTLRLVINEPGMKYVAEDIAITDGDTLYSCPYALSAIDSPLLNSRENAVYHWIARKIPLLDRLYVQPLRSIHDVLASWQVAESGDITDILLLSRGGQRSGIADASRMLRLSNRAEFTYPTNQILLSAQYLGYEIDIHEAIETERAILHDLTRDASVAHLHGSPAELFTAVREHILPKKEAA